MVDKSDDAWGQPSWTTTPPNQNLPHPLRHLIRSTTAPRFWADRFGASVQTSVAHVTDRIGGWFAGPKVPANQLNRSKGRMIAQDCVRAVRPLTTIANIEVDGRPVKEQT